MTDATTALAFLEAIAPGQPVTFQTFDDTDAKRKEVIRSSRADPGIIPHLTLAALNEQGAGVFFTVNATKGKRRREVDVTAVRALFIDFDKADPARGGRLGELFTLPPSAVVESSPGKHHAYWFTNGWPLEHFTHAQRTLAAYFETDAKVCDLPRVMRLPGFHHRKGEPFQTRVIQLAGLRYDADTLRDWLATLTPQQSPAMPLGAPPRAAMPKGDTYATRALEKALAAVTTTNEGGRNDALNREACGLFGLAKAGRLNEADVSNALTRAATGAGLGAGEIRTTLESARNAATPRYEGLPRAAPGEVATPADTTPPDTAWATVISLEHLDRAEPPFFRTAEILPAGTTTMLGAHGGTGKSMLALQWAVCIALGRPFIGKETEAGRVLVYSAEDDGERVRHRLRTICQHEGIDPAALDGRLLLLDATNINPTLYGETLDQRRTYTTTHCYARLREDAERFGADVVMIDNASDTYDAEENDRARVRQFIRSLNQLAKDRNAAVLLLAHVDKNTAKGTSDNREGYSGSTAWNNSARSRLFMSGDKDGNLLLAHQKCNLGPMAAPIPLQWRDGVIVGGDEAGGDMEGAQVFARALETADVLRLIHEFTGRGEFISPSINSPANARAMLAGQPGFPPAMKRGKALYDLLRDAERAGYLAKETYRDTQRKPKDRWNVTAAGMAFAGIAPSAPSAPTPEHDALDAEHGAPAPSAPSGAGGIRGGARAFDDPEDMAHPGLLVGGGQPEGQAPTA